MSVIKAIHPINVPERFRVDHLFYMIPEDDIAALLRITNRVNDRSCLGHPPGTILFVGPTASHSEQFPGMNHIRVAILDSSWNDEPIRIDSFYNPRGERYKTIDFDSIAPGGTIEWIRVDRQFKIQKTWRDRPPLL